MTAGWAFTGGPPALGTTATLVEGASFCVCGSGGDIAPEQPHGLFFRDARLLSQWQLLVDGAPPEPLTSSSPAPFATTFVSRARPAPGRADSTLLVLRHRYVGEGMREDIELRNLAQDAVTVHLQVLARSDFADLFEVKEGRVQPRGEHRLAAGHDGLRATRGWRGDERGCRVHGAGWTASAAGFLQADVVVPGRGSWSDCLQVQPVLHGQELPPRYPCDQPVERTVPSRRLQQWRQENPAVVTTHPALAALLARTEEDLGALRITDPEHADRVTVAAGAPWFMTVFGRDSLLTAWMALLVDPTLALGTLRTLARFQGTRTDPGSEQEPGKVLHEMRFGPESAGGAGGTIYYGSVDATPLFVMLLGEAAAWGADPAAVAELLPAADRALSWIQHRRDRNARGFLDYQRATDQGLRNQGWKDSFDGVTFADGRLADAPIALAEVQGYAYAAHRARADLAVQAGDGATARHHGDRADALQEAFERDFWLPERGWYALALDGQGRPVDSLASNLGHCLWTGIVGQDRAASVADHLLSERMFSGWGVRTLASDMAAYNPMSYHNGSVWPHDNAVVVAGLARYGYMEHAQRVALGLVAASTHFGGRLPELFCGFDREEFPAPVPYPTSCSPQAWAAASPLLVLRALLRLDPDVPAGTVWLAPALSQELGDLAVERLPLAGARASLAVRSGRGSVLGLPDALRLVHAPRPPDHG